MLLLACVNYISVWVTEGTEEAMCLWLVDILWRPGEGSQICKQGLCPGPPPLHQL